MDKQDLPQAFGVFKPVGHVVMSFASEAALQAAVDALDVGGIPRTGIVRYTPDQMIEQVDADLQKASPLASIGQEMNLIKAHRNLAEQGYWFLVVPAPDETAIARCGAVARATQAHTAQHYGHFMIEELVDRTPGRTQSFESPDRGLDIATPTRRVG
jgi:hypothetical protein